MGLLASLWLPREASALMDFFQDSVELLQVGEETDSRREERGRAGGRDFASGCFCLRREDSCRAF